MDSSGIVNVIMEWIWAPFKRQLDYLRNIDKNIENLGNRMEELNAQENDVKLEMNRAVMHLGKRSSNEAQIWLKNVEKVKNEFNNIEDDLKGTERRCMKGCFPNFHSRLKLSKLIEQKNNEVIELQSKGRFPNGLFLEPLPNSGKIIPTMTLTGVTSQKILETILNCLMDAEIGKIGVYGMGGVGKTTIMMHINNHLNEAQSFDNVIWVTVSKAMKLEKLQHDIAKAVDLDLSDDEDLTGRATKLFEIFLRKKKFVLFLDDLWCKFPLEKVGIPQPNKENGCKLVLATRLMEVCRGMETEREIKVELLSREESWVLFNDRVGANILQSPEIVNIAKQITEECGCLPLAIITVGRAMRKVNDIRVWRNALEELKNASTEIDGMEDDVFSRLKFSYNHLKNDRTRACLLYCALYPEDYKIYIEELVEYWMAEGLIDEVGDREKEFDKGHAILNELKDACMLESIGTKWVKMHDLVRDLAISITREKPHFIIKAGIGLKEFAVYEGKEDVERISLMDNAINALSGNLKTTKLSTLLLQRNPHLERISNSFLEHTHNLRVLDLSDTKIKLLPESFANLQNLHALLLRFCKLRKLPSLAKLKELRVLDLSYTFLRQLPHDIESLVHLRRLNLCYTEKLKRFPIEVIPKFSYLESLSMFKSRWRWSLNTTEMGKGVELEKLINSARLASLGLSFKDLNSFISYVRSGHWKVLRSYHLGIGMLSRFLTISKGSCSVEIQGCNLITDGSSIVLPDNMLQLALHGCHDITTLSKVPCISNLYQLKECYISRCKAMEYITMLEEIILPNLERLTLRKLPRFVGICDRVRSASNFQKLKTLHVHGCDGLKNFFSPWLLVSLQNLEEIEVWNCSLIEEIVKGEEMSESATNTTTSIVTLPKLNRLYLFSLPELKSIFSGVLICDSLKTIDVWDCRKLKRLPLCVDNIPSDLKHIRGSRKWWNALEWNDSNCKNLLQLFFKEDIEEGEETVVVRRGGREDEEDDYKTDNNQEEEDSDGGDYDDSDDENFEQAR